MEKGESGVEEEIDKEEEERVETIFWYTTRGGHSHRRCSHSCDRGQEAVKGSRAVFGVGQAVKDNFQTR